MAQRPNPFVNLAVHEAIDLARFVQPELDRAKNVAHLQRLLARAQLLPEGTTGRDEIIIAVSVNLGRELGEAYNVSVF